MENLPLGIPLAHQPCQTDLSFLAIASLLGICIQLYSWISGYWLSYGLTTTLVFCCRDQASAEVDTLISAVPAKMIAKWVILEVPYTAFAQDKSV